MTAWVIHIWILHQVGIAVRDKMILSFKLGVFKFNLGLKPRKKVQSRAKPIKSPVDLNLMQFSTLLHIMYDGKMPGNYHVSQFDKSTLCTMGKFIRKLPLTWLRRNCWVNSIHCYYGNWDCQTSKGFDKHVAAGNAASDCYAILTTSSSWHRTI